MTVRDDIDTIDLAHLDRMVADLGRRLSKRRDGELPDTALIYSNAVLGALARVKDHRAYAVYLAAQINTHGAHGETTTEDIDDAIERLTAYRERIQ